MLPYPGPIWPAEIIMLLAADRTYAATGLLCPKADRPDILGTCQEYNSITVSLHPENQDRDVTCVQTVSAAHVVPLYAALAGSTQRD